MSAHRSEMVSFHVTNLAWYVWLICLATSALVFWTTTPATHWQASQRTLKPLKAFILREEPLEPLKCLFGPLSAFIFTFEPLFSAFCP